MENFKLEQQKQFEAAVSNPIPTKENLHGAISMLEARVIELRTKGDLVSADQVERTALELTALCEVHYPVVPFFAAAARVARAIHWELSECFRFPEGLKLSDVFKVHVVDYLLNHYDPINELEFE